MRVPLLIILCAAVSIAELRTVDIRVSGLDCTSCAESVDRKLGRMRGVESARFDPATNTASLRLKPDNTITLATIRDALKSMGYTPQDANIIVQGELRDGVLSMKHQARAFLIEGAKESGAVVVEGTVASGTDRLLARTVRPQH